MSTPMLLVYVPYATIAIALTILLARLLSRHGKVFLLDVFPAKPELAVALNQLLVIGFYLVNLGWALLLLHVEVAAVDDTNAAITLLTTKLGELLLLLGAAHFANLIVFHRIRSGRDTAAPRDAWRPTSATGPAA